MITMTIKKYTIYSAINPHDKKEVSAREQKEYLKSKFWKKTWYEAWVFFYCYFPPSTSPSLCRLLLVLSGQLFISKGFDEALKTAWDLSEKMFSNKLNITSVENDKYKKIIEALDSSYPKDSLLDDIILWARDKKIITYEKATFLIKNIESVRNGIVRNESISDEVVLETLNLFINGNISVPVLYHDISELLFPKNDFLGELKDRSYLSSGDNFYFDIRQLMKWLMQNGHFPEKWIDRFIHLKRESIEEGVFLAPKTFTLTQLQEWLEKNAPLDDRDILFHVKNGHFGMYLVDKGLSSWVLISPRPSKRMTQYKKRYDGLNRIVIPKDDPYKLSEKLMCGQSISDNGFFDVTDEEHEYGMCSQFNLHGKEEKITVDDARFIVEEVKAHFMARKKKNRSKKAMENGKKSGSARRETAVARWASIKPSILIVAKDNEGSTASHIARVAIENRKINVGGISANTLSRYIREDDEFEKFIKKQRRS